MARSRHRPIDDLTDPGAVHRAIAEHDTHGREAFNARYGFGGARRYHLVHNGQRYDATSILMAAFGYQYPDHGPLTNTELASTRHEVHDPLVRLGFTVVEDPHADPRTAISELTDPAAVVAAMEECDRLGREAFRARYAVGPAGGSFIVFGERLYDAQAIARRAYGIQHGDPPALTARPFRGGAATVQRVLAQLGFVVVAPDPATGRGLDAAERAELAADPEGPPIAAVEAALAAMTVLVADEPVLTEPAAMTLTARTARSAAFRIVVRRVYDFRCAVCGLAIRSPSGEPEVEAAHIFPRSHHGSDDPRNGIALCQHHHWCFDRGLFTIADDGTFRVPDDLPDTLDYDGIRALAGRRPIVPADPRFAPHPLFLTARRTMLDHE